MRSITITIYANIYAVKSALGRVFESRTKSHLDKMASGIKCFPLLE